MASSLVTLDVLARLALEAKRQGCSVSVHPASDELRDLIELAGLTETLGVEPRRQAEEREERVGVQEERQLDDPPV
jgi:hypothetical protein